MKLHFTRKDFLHKPMYVSVCRIITVCVQPVWPMVLHGRTHLHISVLCLTATQLLLHLITRKPQDLFCDFPNSRPANLPECCWYYSLQNWLPTVLTQRVFPYPP